MEQETFFSEKTSFHKNYKKYGSNQQRNQQTEVLVRHDLVKTDTLQGIALKYGCSVSELRNYEEKSVSYDNKKISSPFSLSLSFCRWSKLEEQTDSLQTTVSFSANF